MKRKKIVWATEKGHKQLKRIAAEMGITMQDALEKLTASEHEKKQPPRHSPFRL